MRKNTQQESSVDTSLGRNIGGFIKGAAIGYAAVEGASLIKNAMDARKEQQQQAQANEVALQQQNEMLEEALVKPHLKIGGACAEYINQTTMEEKMANLFDPSAPGYEEHGKILDDMFNKF